MKKPLVSIIMGSDSDFPKMKGAQDILEKLQIPFEIKIVSAHRTPKMMVQFASQAKRRGIQVIIAGAGGSAHLPGMVAAVTTLPVIGVPVLNGQLKGLDALLSIIQMPQGVPVATMGIDNSTNAGLLAARILSLGNKKIFQSLVQFQKSQQTKVRLANIKIKKLT